MIATARVGSVLVALGLLHEACGSGAPAAPPSSAPPTSIALPVATVVAPVATPPPVTAARAAPPSSSVLATRRAAIDAAHASARTEHWDAALTSLEVALAITPHDARLRCETGYVAYRAGQVELADRFIAAAQRALPDPAATSEAMRAPVAMCLYNAGLVHEARGRADAARTAYVASLALRPNDTVQEHLDRLGGPPAHVDGVLVLDGLDDDAVDARVWAAACGDEEGGCAPGHHETDAFWSDITRGDVPLAIGDAAHAPFVARLVRFEIDSSAAMYGETRSTLWLVVRDGTQVQAGRVAEDVGTENFTCDSDAPRFSWTDVIPGGPPELVIDASGCGIEGGWCGDGSAERTLVVCAAAPMRCVQISLAEESLVTSGDGCDGSGEGPQTRYGYRIDATMDQGTLTLRPTFGSAPIPSLVGPHPILTLFDRTELRWRPPG